MKPQLAYTIQSTKDLRYPVLASPKLDGIRALVLDGQLVSRSLKPIPNVHIHRSLPLARMEGFDGELIVGDPCAKDCFNMTTSGVMSKEGEPDFCYYVFDWFCKPKLPYYNRREWLRLKDMPNIKYVNDTFITNESQLKSFEEDMINLGYEGVMIRDPNAPYKYGRSTSKEGYIGKLKRFADSEAIVLDFIERMHNTNEAVMNALGYTERSTSKLGKEGAETLGALVVQDCNSQVVFEIGTGFNDTLRNEIWNNRDKYKGALVKYKHFKIGALDKPRFPVFVGFRHEEDL